VYIITSKDVAAIFFIFYGGVAIVFNACGFHKSINFVVHN